LILIIVIIKKTKIIKKIISIMHQFGKKNLTTNFSQFGKKFTGVFHQFGKKHYGLINHLHRTVHEFNSMPMPLEVSAISKPTETLLNVARKVSKPKKSKIEK